MKTIRALVITAEDNDTSVSILPSCFVWSDVSNNRARPVSRTKVPKEAGVAAPGMLCAAAAAFRGTHAGFQQSEHPTSA